MIGSDDLWQGWLRAALTSSLLLAVGSIAVALTRAPVRRSRLVLVTMGGACLAPLLGLMPGLPRWSAPVLPGDSSGRDRGAIVPLGGVTLRADRGPSLPADLPTPPTPAALEPAPGRGATSPILALAPPRQAIDPRRLILVAHLAGAAGWLGWWGVGLIVLGRVARSGHPVDRATRGRFDALAGPAGARVRLLASDRIAAPFTFTWWRPTILLPAELIGHGSDDELQFALAHECWHVAKDDYRSWTFASLAGLWLGFNPLYWLLRRELRLGQDFLADDHAAATESPADCAAYLVRLARTRRARASFPLPALGVAGRRSHLFRRVAMLLADRAPHATRCRPGWTAAVAALAGLLVLATAAVRLDAAAPPEPTARAQIPLDGREWVGRVVDQATGQPIAGAAVRVEISTSREPRTTALTRLRDVSATTPADGSYRFNLSPEEQADRYLYINLVVADGDHLHYFGGYSYAMLLKNIDLGERPFFEKLELVPGSPVTGVVVQPDGRPAAAVRIHAFSSPGTGGLPAMGGVFSNTRTDADGRFRLVLHPAGPAVVWVVPEQFAPVTLAPKRDNRGDMGTIRLTEGVRINGRVIDAAGKPVGGIYVRANRDSPPAAGDSEIPFGIGDSTHRSTVTLADGTFAFGPFRPGAYMVQPISEWWDPATYDEATDRPDRPLGDVFLGQKIELQATREPEPITIEAVPHVTVTAQGYDSKGERKRGFQANLAGKIDGKWWSSRTRTTPDGLYNLIAPKGLENASFLLMTNEHGAMRYRMSKDGPLSPDTTIHLGTLDHDVSGIEIMRYVSPIILIKATDKEGKAIKGFHAAVIYTAPLGRAVNRDKPKDQIRTDIHLEGPQEDGRFRTWNLPPDDEFEVIAAADGFKPASRLVKLPEGKVEEVAFVLEPK